MIFSIFALDGGKFVSHFRTQYGHDESPHAVNKLPKCVTFPKSTDDIHWQVAEKL